MGTCDVCVSLLVKNDLVTYVQCHRAHYTGMQADYTLETAANLDVVIRLCQLTSGGFRPHNHNTRTQYLCLFTFLQQATVVLFYHNQVENTGTQSEKYAKYAMEEV